MDTFFYGSISYREVPPEGGFVSRFCGEWAKKYQKDFSTLYSRETDFGSMFHKKGGDRRMFSFEDSQPICLVVPKTAAGLQGQQPLVKQDKVGKGSRLNGWVTLGEPLALNVSKVRIDCMLSICILRFFHFYLFFIFRSEKRMKMVKEGYVNVAYNNRY